MSISTLRLGIIGCGDFLRIQAPRIKLSARSGLVVSVLYDPDAARVQKFADEFGGRVAESAADLIEASDVDAVAIFVPPWARKPLMLQAARAGKHILTTKPLAPTEADCAEILEAVAAAGITCGVTYNRTEDSKVETLKTVLLEGRFGKLALFKQDWLHHYPSWNTWALDPTRNGGPFMDAMIHNLNIVRYLMGRPATRGTFFSDRHAHPDLPCADTEFLKLDFEEQGAAHLFITWAADLAVHDTGGNFREHIDIWYAVTDKGWRITPEKRDNANVLVFSREGKQEIIPVTPLTETPYECLLTAIKTKQPLGRILPSLKEAAEDIRIIRQTGKSLGTSTAL